MQRRWLCLSLCLAGCQQPASADLHGQTAALRPDAEDPAELVFHFGPDDVVESHDGAQGLVRVHFTRAGDNAVRADDANADGVPDDVAEVAVRYETVLVAYAAQGFAAPASDLGTPAGDGGDAKLDVYMLDFATRSDGAFVRERCTEDLPSVCAGYVVQENDFAGYRYDSFAEGTRVLATHELFHAVQAAYDADLGSNLGEGTAGWASEQLDPELTDFEAQIGGWLKGPERSIDQDPIGPVDPFAYGLALVFQYFDERFGPELLRELLEGCRDGAGGVANPQWLDVLGALLEARGSSFEEAWLELTSWTLRSGLGGAPGSTWREAAGYPRVARVSGTLPFADESVRMFHASLRAWSFAPEGRSEVAAVLVAPEGVSLDELALFVAARRGDELTVSQVRGTARASISAEGADEIMVAIANPKASGPSLQPKLCVGSAAELAACAPGSAEPEADAGSGGCTLAHGGGTWWPLSLVLISLRRRKRTSKAVAVADAVKVDVNVRGR